MLEEVLLAGERPRELDDDVSTGCSAGVDIGSHSVQTSSVFSSTRFESDGVCEHRVGLRAVDGAGRRRNRGAEDAGKGRQGATGHGFLGFCSSNSDVTPFSVRDLSDKPQINCGGF